MPEVGGAHIRGIHRHGIPVRLARLPGRLGHASDSAANPINGGTMLGFGPGGQNVNAQIGGDGSFDVPVSAGSWTKAKSS